MVLAVGLLACAAVGEPGAEGTSSLAEFQERVDPGDLKNWNLLFITLDTVRADHIGCYGYGRAATPTIDGLAARGVQFMHAVTPVPSTLPSHCTMMTGLDPPGHGVRTNANFVLDERFKTLAEVLKGQGYATAAFIAAFVLDADYGIGQGFDEYDDRIEYGTDRGQRRAKRRPAATMTTLAINWLEGHLKDHPDQPYFMWVHYFDPHLPYEPPGEYARLFPDAPYDGEIAYTDAQLRRLLDFLDERGERKRTLIVLVSDHGEGLGDHGEERHSRLIYDSTMTIPLIFSWPEFYKRACRVDNVTVGLIDIMPTVLSLLGVKADLNMDGVDLVSTPIRRDRALYLETLAPRLYHGWASLYGLRRIDAKYIKAPTPEYYKLVDDPGELRNLLETDPNVHEVLSAKLTTMMARWPSTDEAASKAAQLSEGVKRELAGLGYVTAAVDDYAPSASRPDPKDMVPLFRDIKYGSAEHCHTKSRGTVVRPDADRGAYRRALILARTTLFKAAQSNEPKRPMYLTTLGMAQYRVGDYASALETFAELEEMALRSGVTLNSTAQAFRAMAFHRLGRKDRARAELAHLREAMSHSAETEQEAAKAFLSEAEATILN